MRLILPMLLLILLLAACMEVEIPNPDPPEIPAGEDAAPSLTCDSSLDCRKYHACREMLCANMDEINQDISDAILEECDIDITRYDPPGAFAVCECVENTCQFV